MRLLIDQNLQEDVAEVFRKRGHDVIYSRDILLLNSPDALIAIAGAFQDLIVVTHDRDFRRFTALFPQGFRQKARSTTGRIVVGLKNPVHSPSRIEDVIEEIEFLYLRARAKQKRLLLMIIETNITSIDNARHP